MNKCNRKTQTEKKEMATKPSTVPGAIPMCNTRNRITEAHEAHTMSVSQPKYLSQVIVSDRETINSLPLMEKMAFEFLVEIGDVVLEG